MVYHCLAAQSLQNSLKEEEEAPVFLLGKACLILLYKVWTLPGESFLMIFRTAVRLTSHKIGPKGLYPEDMFKNDVSEKKSFDWAISGAYFIS